MNTDNKLVRNLGMYLVAASASALLLASPVYAQSDEANQGASEQGQQSDEMGTTQQEQPGDMETGQQQQTGEMDATQQQAGDQRSLEDMSLDELKGQTVVNSDGEELGEISEVVVSQDESQAGAVLSVGGMLGVGADKAMAPLDKLSMKEGRLVWDTANTQDEIKQSSDYQEDNFTEASSDEYQNLGELKQSIGQ